MYLKISKQNIQIYELSHFVDKLKNDNNSYG